MESFTDEELKEYAARQDCKAEYVDTTTRLIMRRPFKTDKGFHYNKEDVIESIDGGKFDEDLFSEIVAYCFKCRDEKYKAEAAAIDGYRDPSRNNAELPREITGVPGFMGDVPMAQPRRMPPIIGDPAVSPLLLPRVDPRAPDGTDSMRQSTPRPPGRFGLSKKSGVFPRPSDDFMDG
jgi:hypothetical protein